LRPIPRPIRRLIRLRLTVAFALAMAVVFAVAGLLLYRYLQSSLDRTLDQSLRARATDVAALVSQADHGLTESSCSRMGAADLRRSSIGRAGVRPDAWASAKPAALAPGPRAREAIACVRPARTSGRRIAEERDAALEQALAFYEQKGNVVMAERVRERLRV
jgi:hypothetical protein